MKKIFLSFLSALTLFSCGTDLEQNSPIQPDFDGASPESLVNASYAYLKAAVNFNFYFGDLRSDDGFSDSDEEPHILFDQFDADLIRTSDEMLEPFWKGHVFSIVHNNYAVLNSAAGSEISGEAKFLRAYSYFSLVNVFGGVPVVTSAVSPEDINAVGRNSVVEVYGQIEADLMEAIASLPSENSDGRPSSVSAQALLGKVYMYQGKTTLAEPMLKSVVDNSNVSILSKYEDVFSNDNELNSEILFAVQYSTSDVNPGALDDTDLDMTNIFSNALSGSEPKIRYPVTASLTDVYSSSDVRDEATFDGTSVIKYLPEDTTQTSDTESDYIVLRFADIVLLYAEAVNANESLTISNTISLLDDIRERAGLGVLSAADFTTRKDVEDVIKLERRLELAFEGQRWFDLVRWGDAKPTLEFSDDNWLLFPLPLREVNSNGGATAQNPGY